jgi:hypothetical protein
VDAGRVDVRDADPVMAAAIARGGRRRGGGWLWLLPALLLATDGAAQEQRAPPPDWMVRGFEAAFLDDSAGAAYAATRFRRYLDAMTALAQAGRAERVATRAVEFLISGDRVRHEAGARAMYTRFGTQVTDEAWDRLLDLVAAGDEVFRHFLAARPPLGIADALSFSDMTRSLRALDAALIALRRGEEASDDVAWAVLKAVIADEHGEAALSRLVSMADAGDGPVLRVLLRVLASEALPARLSVAQQARIVALAQAALDADEQREAAASFLAARAERLAPRLSRLALSDTMSSDDPEDRRIGLAIALDPTLEAGEAEVAMLMSRLASPEPGVRSAALKLLQAVPPARRAGDLFPSLQSLLADPDAEVRGFAFRALSIDVAGEDAERMMAVIGPLIARQGADGALEAAETLARGGAVRPFLAVVLPLLAHTDPLMRARALKAIQAAQLGPGPHMWSAPAGARGATLEADLPSIRQAAAEAILPLLSDPHWAVRDQAAVALTDLRAEGIAGRVVDHLLPGLRDRDTNARAAASRALALLPLADRAEAVIEAVLASLPDADEQPHRWKSAAVAGAATGPLGPSTASRLQAMLVGEDGVLRIFAAQALARMATAEIAATDPAAVAALLRLGHAQPSRRHADAARAAIRLLERLVPARGLSITDFAVPLTAILLGATGPEDADAALALVERWGPLSPDAALAALAMASVPRGGGPGGARAVGLIVTGAHPDVVALLAWIGGPGTTPLTSVTGAPQAANALLALFATYWSGIAASEPLHVEALQRIGDIARAACPGGAASGCWTEPQAMVAAHLLARLRETSPEDAARLGPYLAR